MVEASGCPLSISVAAEDHRAPVAALRDRIAAAAADGLPIKRPGRRPRHRRAARPAGDVQPVRRAAPAYREVAALPLDRAGACARATRAARGAPRRARRRAARSGGFDRIFELGDPPDYEPAPGDSIAARAAREGVEPRRPRLRPAARRRRPRPPLPAVPQLGRRLARRHRRDARRPAPRARARRRRRPRRHHLRRQLPDDAAHPLGARPRSRACRSSGSSPASAVPPPRPSACSTGACSRRACAPT